MGSFLNELKKKPDQPYPSIFAMHGTPGWGKTSFGAMMPSPVFIMSRNETGLIKLITEGQVPETAYGPPAERFPEVVEAVKELATQPHDFKTLVIDTMSGVEEMHTQHMIDTCFGGDAGREGFGSFGQGKKIVERDWPNFLSALERLRTQRNMTVLMLYHSAIKTVNNPMGPDYDRFEPKPTPGATEATIKYADAVLFATYDINITGAKGQEIAKDGRRVIRTVDHPAYVAKNRFGFPALIPCDSSPRKIWETISGHIRNARATAAAMNGTPPAPPSPPTPTTPKTVEHANAPVAPVAPVSPPAPVVVPPAPPVPAISDGELQHALGQCGWTEDQIRQQVADWAMVPHLWTFESLTADHRNRIMDRIKVFLSKRGKALEPFPGTPQPITPADVANAPAGPPAPETVPFPTQQSERPLVNVVVAMFDSDKAPWASEKVRLRVAEILGRDVPEGTKVDDLTDADLSKVILEANKKAPKKKAS